MARTMHRPGKLAPDIFELNYVKINSEIDVAVNLCHNFDVNSTLIPPSLPSPIPCWLPCRQLGFKVHNFVGMSKDTDTVVDCKTWYIRYRHTHHAC